MTGSQKIELYFRTLYLRGEVMNSNEKPQNNKLSVYDIETEEENIR